MLQFLHTLYKKLSTLGRVAEHRLSCLFFCPPKSNVDKKPEFVHNFV